MFDFLLKAPAWQLIAQSDAITKLILFGLFILSVFCIWIVLSKYLVFRRQRRAMEQLMVQVRKVRTFDEFLTLGKQYQECVGGRFLIKALGDLKDILQAEKGSDKGRLTPENVEQFQILLEQLVGHSVAEESQYLAVLSTSAAVSPLIGLFGTVWGLIHAFVDISKSRSADIAVVAPGIAEALITTLAGLMVAIPALIFFHYFAHDLRKIEQQLWNISDKFLGIVKQTFVSL